MALVRKPDGRYYVRVWLPQERDEAALWRELGAREVARAYEEVLADRK